MRRSLLAIIPLIVLLVACTEGDNGQSGRIILWHVAGGERGQALEQAVERYTDIHPEVTVIVQEVPAEGLHERFASSASQGLGPDLLLGSSSQLGELIAESIVAPIPESVTVGSEAIAPARASVQYQGQSYGLPLTMNVVALAYNSDLAGQAPVTLDELYDAVESGQTMGFDSSFAGSYWGIETMGEALFDADGSMRPLGSGLVDWLDWLKRAQDLPQMIMSREAVELNELFAAGDVAYYVVGPEALGGLSEALGDDLAVALLPEGPGGAAGPIMTTSAFLFNWASSEQQAEIALEVGQFLTNQEQSTIFLREARIVPANRLVRVDPRIYPLLGPFQQQSLTATTLPGDLDRALFFEAGDRMIGRVLTGIATAEEAACDFGRTMAETGAMVDLTGCEETTDG
jgi:arabinogalactan oligomer/maltooligosaccharide transport system substrate-binding protein